MKIFNNTNNYDLWTLLKDDFRSIAYKNKNGLYQNEEVICLFQYIIGKEPPVEKYKMHFSKKPKNIFLYNRQFLTLRMTTPYLAKQWLINNYKFYENEKNKYLDYFEDGIIGHISNLKLNEKQTVSLRSCLEWIRLERENLNQEKQNEEKNKIKDLTQKNELLLSAIEKLESEKKWFEETLLSERKIYRDLEIKNIELNATNESKIAEIEILNNSNLTLSNFLDPENSKIPKITLPNNSKDIRVKIIQYLDLLNVGTAQEISEGKVKIGVIKFENDEAFVNILKNINEFKKLKEGTIKAEINEARNRHKENLDQIPDEFIKWALVHFGIEK